MTDEQGPEVNVVYGTANVVTSHGFTLDRDGTATFTQTDETGREEVFVSTPEDRERAIAEIEASLPPWPEIDPFEEGRSTDESNDHCPMRPILREERPEPHGWLQWKGTTICMDIQCGCGKHLHLDYDFFCYAIRCPYCGRCYELDGHIRLIPMSEPCPWHHPVLVQPNGLGEPPWSARNDDDE